MRYYRKATLLPFLLMISFYSYAQQMVERPQDISLICLRDEQFIGKPLSTLFKELKPSITLVLPREGWVPEVTPAFTFFFTSMDVFRRYRQKNKFPLRLTVYLKNPFLWEWEKRKGFKNRDRYLDWTKEDEIMYGDLIIIAIRVEGEYKESDYEK